MKNINKILTVIAVSASVLATSCIKETFPQNSPITGDQATNAPGAFNNFVSTITSTLTGQFTYGGSDYSPWDFGYPSFFLQRDAFGQDIAPESSDRYAAWYQVSVGLGPQYAICQVPWTYYYKWINNCNIVLSMCGDAPTDGQKTGAGIAHAMRAMFYMDLARMYQYTYKGHEQAGTVPIVTEKTTGAELTNNPRATNENIWKFIISDLDAAEVLLANYKRSDVYTPDVSVVYGLKARAYLTMENFVEAEAYAKKAQVGYTALSQAQYTDKMVGFNTPNNAWMFGVTYKADDPNILANDSDSNWGSQWFVEVGGDCLYAGNYGSPKRMDVHLYSTIPDSDCRKKCFVSPDADDAASLDALKLLLKAYTDYPENVIQAVSATDSKSFAGLALKFRPGGGVEGRKGNQYLATVVAVPLMRVEEMMLIEAEAVGMQNGKEAQGVALLTAFGKQRDASYTYNTLTPFRDNVWWQRRVELWGEGFATFDIKRLNKGIIRSYAGSNHPNGYRFNTTEVPGWMNLCIVQSEGNYNFGLGENNPTPTAPEANSPEHVW